MDDNLESLRSEEDLLRNWLDASNVTLGYKNIHTLEDIPILTKGLHDNPPPFIHLSCHGFHDSDGRAYILLAPRARKKDHIYLNDRKTQRVFRKNFRGVPILFSACLLGKYQDEMKEFREAAALGPVAGFTREISDSEAMLFELLLYQGVLMKGWNFSRAVEKACDAMALVGVLGSQGKAQRFVRVF